MSRACVWVAALGASIAGCDACAATPTEETRAATVEMNEVVSVAENVADEDESAGELPIGFEVGGRTAVPDEAVEANTRALARHRAGEYAASRAGFEGSLELDATYDTARYNLACALARLGELEQAARELDALVTRDLPRFGSKLDTDEDLEALRDSEPGRRLAARIVALTAEWTAAIETGIPAAFHVPAAHGTRFGFWLRERGRFVPVVAPNDATDGVIDLARRRVAMIEASYPDADSDGVFMIETVWVAPFYPPGGEVVEARADTMGYGDSPNLSSHAIDVSSDAVRFFMEKEWRTLTGRRLRAGPSTPPAPRSHERPPEGFALRGNLLMVDGSAEGIELGSGHAASRWHSFAIDERRTRIIVASERETSRAEPVAFEQYAAAHRTFYDHVDLETREVTRLGVGEAGGYVVAHGGDAYLVGMGNARRYPGVVATEYEELPRGLVPLPD